MDHRNLPGTWFPGVTLALLLALAFSGVVLPATPGEDGKVQLTVQVGDEQVTVGDAVDIRIQVTSDSSIELIEPDPSMDLGDFELLDARVEQKEGSAETGPTNTLVLRVTSFKTGDLEVPPISVRYHLAETDEALTASTEPIPIRVESVLPEDAQDILDIKPPLEIPRDWLPIILLSFLIAALAIGAALLLRRHFRKRGKGPSPTPREPALPPHVTAYAALEKLRKSQLLDNGQLTPFYVRVSEIIRRYFEERFRIDALEMSTPEVLKDLAATGDVDGHMPVFREFLGRCDLVKFAKFLPHREQSDRVLELAFQIVDSTKETRSDDGDQKTEEAANG